MPLLRSGRSKPIPSLYSKIRNKTLGRSIFIQRTVPQGNTVLPISSICSASCSISVPSMVQSPYTSTDNTSGCITLLAYLSPCFLSLLMFINLTVSTKSDKTKIKRNVYHSSQYGGQYPDPHLEFMFCMMVSSLLFTGPGFI